MTQTTGMSSNISDKRITLGDKQFGLYIPCEAIEQSVAAMAKRIDRDYADRPNPLFLGVLNGSFMFLAELVKRIGIPCEISFVKLASYNDE